jgi:NAD(P)-dependent dehydrogenase (short-subunit alcohol dehydrogenase family)
MSGEYIKKAIDSLGCFGFVRVVVESCWKVPSRPQPPNKFADQVWANELSANLRGKVYAITGASNGMGKFLAEMLARRGATVIMLNRKSSHSAAAFEDVKKVAANGAAVHLVDCDLCSFASVRSAASSILSISHELDSLVCNAGLMAQADKRTVDGYDLQIQANHLSHFLLTSLLFDAMVATGKKRGEPARIVQHSSGACNAPDVILSADCFEKSWQPLINEKTNKDENPRAGDKFGKWRRYQQSKRLNLGFTYAMADYIKNKGLEQYVIATCAHPGATNSGLQSRTAASGFMDNLINGIAACAGHSTADGCLGLALATLLPGAQNGSFYGPVSMVGNAVLLNSEREKYDQGQLDLIMNASSKVTGASFK